MPRMIRSIFTPSLARPCNSALMTSHRFRGHCLVCDDMRGRPGLCGQGFPYQLQQALFQGEKGACNSFFMPQGLGPCQLALVEEFVHVFVKGQGPTSDAVVRW